MAKSILRMHEVACSLYFALRTGTMNTALVTFGLIDILIHKGVLRVCGETDLLHIYLVWPLKFG